MKIKFEHIAQNIKETVSIDDISSKLFQLGHEHEIHNNIFDIEFTPNRGDCLSIKGILRDLAAFYTVNDRKDLFEGEINTFPINFKNNYIEACPTISFLRIEIGDNIKEYQNDLKNYFNDLQLNKNNFFTDISNYLSYETGQPTHCYDAKKIDGEIVLENYESEYDLETLLDKNIKLTNSNAVFKIDKKIINLAGVVGDKSTSCTSKTREVIIECAYFNPEIIIGKSIKYDIKSDAAHKFERGVDPSSHEYVLRRFINIVKDHTEIKRLELFSETYKEPEKITINLDVKKINKILGISIAKDDYIEHLIKLGFEVSNTKIIVPSHRSDIKHENDLAEEVARIIGYDNIPVAKLELPKLSNKKTFLEERKLKQILINDGFYEVINFPFTSVDDNNSLTVDNPLDSNKKYLRKNLRHSLIENLLFNERRQQDSVKLFEISDIYEVDFEKNKLLKKRVLGIIASGRIAKNYKEFSKKIDKNYIDKILEKICDDVAVQSTLLDRTNMNSKLKNNIYYVELDLQRFDYGNLEDITDDFHLNKFNKYEEISEFPCSIRDLSFSVKDSVDLDILYKKINEFKYDILKENYIFDFFYNNKTKEIKIGYRFIFQSKTKTLTDYDVDNVVNDIIENTTKINSISIPGL